MIQFLRRWTTAGPQAPDASVSMRGEIGQVIGDRPLPDVSPAIYFGFDTYAIGSGERSQL